MWMGLPCNPGTWSPLVTILPLSPQSGDTEPLCHLSLGLTTISLEPRPFPPLLRDGPHCHPPSLPPPFSSCCLLLGNCLLPLSFPAPPSGLLLPCLVAGRR